LTVEEAEARRDWIFYHVGLFGTREFCGTAERVRVKEVKEVKELGVSSWFMSFMVQST
jgi:hypothetical protein